MIPEWILMVIDVQCSEAVVMTSSRDDSATQPYEHLRAIRMSAGLQPAHTKTLAQTSSTLFPIEYPK